MSRSKYEPCGKCGKRNSGVAFWVSIRLDEKDSEGMGIAKENFRGWLCRDCNYERRSVYYESLNLPNEEWDSAAATLHAIIRKSMNRAVEEGVAQDWEDYSAKICFLQCGSAHSSYCQAIKAVIATGGLNGLHDFLNDLSNDRRERDELLPPVGEVASGGDTDHDHHGAHA